MQYATPDLAHRAYRQDPARFFDGLHREVAGDETALISPQWRPAMSRYHYNLVENAILDVWYPRGAVAGRPVLDIGSGTGHWVEFALSTLEAGSVDAVDFSNVAVEALRRRFADQERVCAQVGDVTVSLPSCAGGYDWISAIGIFFHIVDDLEWQRAVENVIEALAPGGVAVFGGAFGNQDAELGVLRKVRSLDRWRTVVRSAGGEVLRVRLFEWFGNRDARGLKNNLLFVQRAAAGSQP